MEAIDVSSADDIDQRGALVGDVFNIKGKLAAVRYGGINGARTCLTERKGRFAGVFSVPEHGDPSIIITCADWSQISVTVRDYATAKGIRIPLSAYVCVKAQVVHEDGDLMALAIWELGGGAVMPLGDAMTTIPRHVA